MHVVDFDRYRLRLSLECPLVGIEERTRRAFDVYFAELVRDGQEITGPVNVVRKATLGEISFVDLGADGRTSASIAGLAASHRAHGGRA